MNKLRTLLVQAQLSWKHPAENRHHLESLIDAAGEDFDLAVLPVFADERPLVGLAGLVDWRASGRLSRLLLRGHLSGAPGERLLTPGGSALPARRLVLLGAGNSARLDEAGAAELAERAVSMAMRLRPETVLMAVPCRLVARGVAEAFVAGVRDAVWTLEPLEPPSAESFEGAGRASEVEGSEADEPRLRVVRPLTPRPRLVLAIEGDLLARARRLLSGPPQAATSPG